MVERIRNDNALQRESNPSDANKRGDEPDSRPLVTPPPETNARYAEGVTTPGNRRQGQSVATATAKAEERAPLFASNETNDFRSRWDSVQASFVDEPRKAVEQADQLVSSAITRLSEIFAQERQNLEKQWDRGTEVSTEDFRVALRRYRSFFSRLLEI